MSAEDVEQQGLALVANGAFNPKIFHPSWLALKGIISAAEAEAAELEVTHREIAQFSLPSLKFEVQAERFVLHCAEEPFALALDTFLQIFGENLHETPISALGINYYVHADLGSWEKRQRFGRLLAPIGPWGEFGQAMEQEDPELAGGLTSLTMRSQLPHVSNASQLGVTIQPSAKMKLSGIFLSVNHHFKFAEALSTRDWCRTLAREFDDALATSRKIVGAMIAEAEQA